jgi:predicted  nucleic acid-binding Zn-ribbon protein
MDAVPAHVAADEAVYKQAQKEHDSAGQQQLALDKKKKDKERQIEELTDKITKMKSRAAEIKTNKEYQANLKEIESFESQIRTVEDDLLEIMEALETASKDAAAQNLKFATAKAEAEAIGKERSKEISVAEQEIQSLKAKRKELAEAIEPELYKQYMGILMSCRGIAVAEVVKEICQGCSMNIPPQLFVRIKNKEDIFECPQCRRILYYIKPETEKQEEAAPQKAES